MSEKKSVLSHSIDSLFVLLLFGLFIIMAMLVTAYGATAYKNSAKQSDKRFNTQTCINYVTAKVRANNEKGKISVTDLDSVNALCITDSFGGQEYNTYIYQYEGKVRELFINSAASIDLGAGSELTDAENLTFLQENGLLECTLTDSDNDVSVFYINIVE